MVNYQFKMEYSSGKFLNIFREIERTNTYVFGNLGYGYLKKLSRIRGFNAPNNQNSLTCKPVAGKVGII